MTAAKRPPLLEKDELAALLEETSPEDQLLSLFESLSPLKQPESVNDLSFEQICSEELNRIPVFLKVHEVFADALKKKYLHLIRDQVHIGEPVVSLTEGADLLAYEASSCYLMFESGSCQMFMIELDSRLLVSFIDILLGGLGECFYQKDKISNVEKHLAIRVADALGLYLQQVWSESIDLSIEASSVHTNLQFLHRTLLDESYISVSYQMSLADGVQQRLNIHYVKSYFDPLLERLRTPTSDEASMVDPVWERDLQTSLAKVPIAVAVQLGTSKTTLRGLLSYHEGDVIVLNRKESDLSTLLIEGLPKFRVRVGLKQGSVAAEVMHAYEEDET